MKRAPSRLHAKRQARSSWLRRCVQALGNLRRCDLRQVAGVGGVIGPDARQTVGVQFDLNGHTLRAGRIGTARLVQHTDQVLHVMTVLVRQHVRLGKGAALRAKARLQFIEEIQVQIDLLIGRAVERPDRGGGVTAGGLG